MIWPFSRKSRSQSGDSSIRLYDELDAEAFKSHPVWLYVHIHDFGDPKYENCDEEAMRPWQNDYPVPIDAVCDVAASFQTADGRELSGSITWDFDNESDAADQIIDHAPRIFLPSGRKISFWHGNVYQFGDAFLQKDKEAFYRELACEGKDVFPITYKIAREILARDVQGVITGFGYRAPQRRWSI